MKEKLREFLRPRLAVLLAASLLAAYLPAMPAAQAAGDAPASYWEDQDGVIDQSFDGTGTELDSYTYSNSDGTTETVPVDHDAPLGSKENPISIPDETALILFGKLTDNATQGNYYILDKQDGVYDMGAHTMLLPLMGDAASDSGMPAPSAPFQGVLIGNGASIENVCVNTDSTVFGLFGAIGKVRVEGVEVTDLTVSLTPASSAKSSIIAAGGLVGHVRNGVTLTNCTANVTGDLGGRYAGGLVGFVREGATLTNCTANVTGNVTGNLTADGSGKAGGLAGFIRDGDATLTNCTATVTGDLTAEGESSIVGGLVGDVSSATLTNCTANVTGVLTAAGKYSNAGGLVGYVSGATLTNCTATVTDELGGQYVGGLVGGVYLDGGTMTLTDCTAKVEDSLRAGYCAGGLVGSVEVVYDGTMTLEDCTAEVMGSLTAADEYGDAGGLVGYVEEGNVTLTDCAVQAVITKPDDSSYAPSGPVGEGAELVTFEGANVTTLRMGAGSSVSLELVNDTALTLDDSGGVLTATGNAVSSETTGSVKITSGGSAEIQVHGGSDPDGRTYTLTGVNGTLRLEDKTDETTPQYWVTADASFGTSDADPLAKGDKVDLLGAAGNRLCTVSVEAGTGGSVSVSNGGPVSAGTEEVTVTATPSDGYRFVGWTEDGQQVSTEAIYAFTVTSSRTLTAVFEVIKPRYTVTVQAETGGSVSSGGTFDEGTEITVEAMPNSGYRFVNWMEDGQEVSTEASYAFTVTSSRTLTAVFEVIKPQYTVTVRAGTGGSVSGGGTFDEGTEITVEVTPESGYRFVNWTENGQHVSAEESYTFEVTASRTLTAVFQRTTPQYTVTVQAGTGGSTTGGGTFDANTSVTVTATPESGYRFVNWTENGQQVSTEASYTFAVTASRTLTAVFERTSSGGSSGGGYTPPKKDEPQTGSSGGWKDIQKELEETKSGDNVDVTMNGATKVPKEVLEGIAGKDVNVNFDMGGGIVWTVNGKDIPSGIGSLNLGIRTGSSSIPVNVFNTITGEKSTMQFTLAHSGSFGTVLHLSLNLGAANRGYWANLYWFDESSKELVFRHSCRIDSEGKASWPFDHASSYAVVIDEKNHDPAWENPFTDISEGDWYYEAVRFVHEQGLMNGYSDGRFGPNDTLSRAQLAQILFNKEGRPVVNYLMQFDDVAGEAWYTEAVRWAASQGIVGGYGNGTFGPNDPITREQLAVMLWRYSGSPAATSKELYFNDTDEISGFALEALRWAVENGILNGYGDGRLGPQGQATRAQVAQMLKNFIENQEENT